MNIEHVWQQYSHALKAMLRSKIANPADVEDLLQEILIKTHKQLGSLKSEDKLKPWLFQLANNTVIDFYRSQGRHQQPEAEELWYGDNEEEVQQQMSECILPFIQGLPAATAQLLDAIDIKGIPQKDYAEQLGISYSTLKSRVQRGRVKLRALFEDCCYLELDPSGNVVSYQAKNKQCRSC